MKKNVDWRFVKQCAMCVTGTAMLLWSAMSVGEDTGRIVGAAKEAEAISYALDDAYGQNIANHIRHDVNGKLGEYRKSN